MTPEGTDSPTTAQESKTPLNNQRRAPQTSGNFPVCKPLTEQNTNSCPAKKNLSEPNRPISTEPSDNHTDWCYIYLHNRKIVSFKAFMDERSPFQSFVMKACPKERQETPAHKGKNRPICKPPQQLIIGGIVFIQGAPDELQQFFKANLLPLTLVRDCATQTPAILSDKMMRPLRQVVELAHERLGFLPKPFAHYAKGHDLIRITEGPLKGLEGCIMRIDRDRKLVMQVGTLTLAIARAHREVYEVVAEASDASPAPSVKAAQCKDGEPLASTQPTHSPYSPQSSPYSPQSSSNSPQSSSYPPQSNPYSPQSTPLRRHLTYLQEQIDNALFFPCSQSDVEIYADNVDTLRTKAEALLAKGKEESATDTLLFLLDEISYHFNALYARRPFDLTPIDAAQQRLTSTITRLLSPDDARLSAAEKEHLSTEFDARMMGNA